MAEIKPIDFEFRIENYFIQTRVRACLSQDCVNFSKHTPDELECGLKIILIGEGGKCRDYKSKESK
jgi:hypothetical protein